jgi:hypothetical protein
MAPSLATAACFPQAVTVTLHQWIDELRGALAVEADLDETQLLQLARSAAHNVERKAAPITTYLLGVAVGAASAGPSEVAELTARAQLLADRWDPSTVITDSTPTHHGQDPGVADEQVAPDA